MCLARAAEAALASNPFYLTWTKSPLHHRRVLPLLLLITVSLLIIGPNVQKVSQALLNNFKRDIKDYMFAVAHIQKKSN